MDKLYLQKCTNLGMSTYAIAKDRGCSQTKVRYWMNKHGVLPANPSTYIKPKKQKQCKNCFAIMTGKKSRNTFCCTSCHKEYVTKDFLQKWKCGIYDQPNGSNTWTRAKSALIYERGELCEDCGWGVTNEHTGKIPIELHHIDGNHRNWNYDNLKILCPNCHSLTSTYKNSNIGRGRESRRKTGV